jgi:hypothetical protein
VETQTARNEKEYTYIEPVAGHALQIDDPRRRQQKASNPHERGDYLPSCGPRRDLLPRFAEDE